MKINELARRLDVTPRAIRFYEEKGLLHPVYGENGYRYYTEEDAWRLQAIAAFRELGFSVGGIAKLLQYADRGDQESFRHYLELQRAVLVSQWVEWKHVLAAMDKLIGKSAERRPLALDDLFGLAASMKRLKSTRSSWEDRWDYDGLAEQFDRSGGEQSASPVGFMASAADYERALSFTGQWLAPRPGEAGLDIGAGTGTLAGRLQQAGARMSAVEQSRQMLVRCRNNYPDVQAKLGNFLALPFLEAEFDFAATHFAFHHLNEEQQTLALEEMDRVLKPHGRIVITALMFEHKEAQEARMNELRLAGRQELLTGLSQRFPADRSKIIGWFRRHDYITVQQQLNDWVHMVYAVRKH
ncbi:putative methyltransferase YrrT [Paenibacillus konkukensis]|uniref:Methyltransferase YrrT n=1 Tax=Paenibacillus konkukensis TaxID=2020716 RepID=A0ABY4RNC6_9BACL|nr:MerR family transcriptional regulator [Paenibacillus konkukensis]UQZ83663.1 putative methyltransferase YrrT [Paenibacillus konkukensis]